MDASGSLTSIPGIVQHDAAYDSIGVTIRGNRTSVQQWTGGTSYLTTGTMTYDTTGQMITAKDQNNNLTTLSYTDCYANDNGSNPPAAYTQSPQTNAFVTTAALPINGPLKECYYFGTGKIAYTKDENNATTYNHFQDLDDRQTTEYFPIGWALNNYTSTTQLDRYLGIQDTTPSTGCASCKHYQMLFDNLGRAANGILVSDPDGQTTVKTDYDSNGRGVDTSHPYRTTSDPTYGFETVRYDGLDRPTQITHQDGTVRMTFYDRNVAAVGGLTTQRCPSGTCALGYPTLTMDEAGKIVEVWKDAFGKTVEVDEPAANASTGGSGTGTGTITFSGSEGSTQVSYQCGPNTCYYTVYDGGNFTATVGGDTESVTYGNGSTSASLASALAGAFNSDPASPATATASGSTVTLTSKFNYSLSVVLTGWNSSYFPQPSFSATASGPNLTGGTTPQLSSPTVTYYLYGPLETLTQVTVLGSQECNRTYAYDTLYRMISATAPEAGNGACSNSTHTTSFYYTTSGGALCSGNASSVCRRTDGRNITTTYTYDALNRLTGMSYSDGSTPSVTYSYDQTSYNGLTITNGLGRRTGMSDGSGTTSWSYDLNGNILTEKRTISGITKTISYAYNQDNSLKSLIYPSGRVINFTVNNAERTTSAIDSNGTQYAIAPSSGAMYAPTGALSSAVYGKGGSFTGLTESRSYNNRLQITGITASSTGGTALNLALGFTNANHANNNGEITSVTNNVDTGRSQNFVYDDLSRLTSALSQAISGPDCWGQSFTLDAVANLTAVTVSQCSSYSFNAAVNGNNQFSTGYTYDGAGNLTNDASYTYTYNAENEITSANGVTYTYDGNGIRVKKSNGTLYWRAIGGSVIAETNLSGTNVNEYVFFGGRRVARRDSGGSLYYYQVDHLGSTRAITNSSGTPCYDADYTPFGQELAHTNSCAQNYKFAGYERDSETGLDYAINRYYNSRIGRFMSADPLGSTNRYAYALNNPLSLVDPLGLSNCGTTSGSGPLRGCDPGDPSISGNDPWTESGQRDLAGMLGGRGIGLGGCDQFCVLEGGDPNITERFNDNWSPWTYQFTGSETVPCNGVVGTFCSQPISRPFDTWNDYANWLTDEAARFGALNALLSQAEGVATSLGLSLESVLAARRELHGGNWNFFLPGVAHPSDCAAGVGGDRCGTFPSLHFTVNRQGYPTGFVHLDSANANFPLPLFGIGDVVHLAVDVILGNTIYASGIP